MTMTDTIADMLTRIRNASHAGHTGVGVPCSKEKQGIARILKEQGFTIPKPLLSWLLWHGNTEPVVKYSPHR